MDDDDTAHWLDQAAADADADLAAIEGVDPDEFLAWINSQRDRWSDLDCEMGDGFKAEMDTLSRHERRQLKRLTDEERHALAEDRRSRG